jgi:predicted transcriptional regulator
VPGIPIITITDVARVTGRSYQTASEYVRTLLEVGILEQVTSGKRNRLFQASELVRVLEEIETFFLPEIPTSREEFFTLSK